VIETPTPGVGAVTGATATAAAPGALRRLLGHRGAAIGLAILAVLVLTAIFAPLFLPHDPNAQDYKNVLTAPNGTYWLGTDSVGRDVFTRIAYGGRVTLVVGLVPVLAGFAIGTSLGVIAGFYGNRIDSVIMRLTDIGLAFPGVLLALVVIAVLGPGLGNVMIAVGIASVPVALRVARGAALVERERLHVSSAIAIGASDLRIIVRHVLPGVFPAVLVVATIEVASAILIAAGLSFLGLGAQPPTAEWGSMLAAGRAQMRSAWWAAAFPGAAIVLAVLAINLVGDGLRDVLDPKSRRR